MTSTQHVYVTIERDEKGFPPFDSEELDALCESGDRFRIVSIPTFVHGIARDDVVRVVRFEGDRQLWIDEVLAESGHWVARVVLRGDRSTQEAVTEFIDRGCDAYVGPLDVVAIDVPPSVEPSDVLNHLRNGEAQGRWFYDLGVSPSQD